MTRYHLIDGVKVQFTVEEEAIRDAEELAFENRAFDRSMVLLRFKRDALLKETDTYALSDRTMSAEMTTYRQALRDITNGLTTVADVEAVVFPEKPEV